MLISAVLLARLSVNRADGKLERARETALAKAIEQDPLWKTAVERAIYNWPTFADLAEEVASSFERKQVTFILPAGIRSTLLKAYLKRVKRPTSKRLIAWHGSLYTRGVTLRSTASHPRKPWTFHVAHWRHRFTDCCLIGYAGTADRLDRFYNMAFKKTTEDQGYTDPTVFPSSAPDRA
jgi:hypothetical protein